MAKRYIALVVLAGLVGLTGVTLSTRADTEKEKTEKKNAIEKNKEQPRLKLLSKEELMALKLKGSQAILESIALNEIKKIQEHAESMVQLADTVAFMNAYKGKEYAFHIKTFRNAAETMHEKAKAHNMDGVMVAFNDLTLTCLKCHTAMRDKKFETSATIKE